MWVAPEPHTDLGLKVLLRCQLLLRAHLCLALVCEGSEGCGAQAWPLPWHRSLVSEENPRTFGLSPKPAWGSWEVPVRWEGLGIEAFATGRDSRSLGSCRAAPSLEGLQEEPCQAVPSGWAGWEGGGPVLAPVPVR